MRHMQRHSSYYNYNLEEQPRPKPFGGKNQQKKTKRNRKARSQSPLPALPQSSVAPATKFLWCLLLLREKPDLTGSFLQQNEFGLKTLQSQL
jgi:hypothetical protein